MLKTRVLSAVVGIPLLLGLLYLGGAYWQGFFILLAILSLGEYYKMMRNRQFKPLQIPGLLMLLVIMHLPLYPDYLIPAVFLTLVVSVVYMVLKYPRFDYIDLALSIFGPCYLGFLFNYSLIIGKMSNSFYIILLAFLLTWCSDIGGYFAGRFWGSHKLAPQLSPAKTWEGALGASVLPVILAMVFFRVIHIESIPLAYVLILGLLTGFTAQFGDLFESGIKRYFNVKDSGNIIPGHGGVMDRFDSFLFVAPVVYYFFVFFVH